MKGKLKTAVPALMTMILFSCPVPIDETALSEMTDYTAPALTISSPADDTDYTQTVTVSGTASDDGRIRLVRYQVIGSLGTLLSGDLPPSSLGSAGEFSFQFSTVSFDGPLIIRVTAEDWNDNSSTLEIGLHDPGSPVSSLTALPSNKSITLDWDAVEGAEDYTLFYTRNGTVPSESYGESVTVTDTGYLLEDLDNGSLHVFLLRANLSAGGVYWSSYVSAIPLSGQTLAPLVQGGYGKILLEWNPIDGTDRFEILRSTSPDGPFLNYTGVIQGTSYEDRGVSEGEWYYYKVRPELEGSLTSYANGAGVFLSSPTPEESITNLTTSGPAQKVVYPDWGGDYVYVAAGEAGLLIIDISMPRAPETVASLQTEDAADLALYDYGPDVHYAFIADGAGKIKSVDISNPLAPVQTGAFTGTLGDARVAETLPDEERLFIVDKSGETAIMAFDIADPDSPVFIAQYGGGGTYEFNDIALSYYLVGGTTPYAFIYATTSNDQMILELYHLLGGSTIVNYRSYTDADYRADYVVTDENYVYVLSRASIYLEPPPPYSLMVLSKYPSSFTKVGNSDASQGFLADIQIRDDKVYAADGLGLQMFDVSDPLNPEMTDYWNTPGASTGVATDGSFCFVTSGSLGFQTVNISLPNDLSLAGLYNPGSGYRGIALRDDLAYMTNNADGLTILDISDTSAPVPVSGGHLALSGAGQIVLSGPYAYITRGTSGLEIVDISDSSAPVSAGSAPALSGSVGRLTVKGDYAYLAGSTGLQIYDISDPSDPYGIGFYDSDGGGMNDVQIRGQTAYVVQGAYFQPNNMTVLDVSNPVLPVLQDRKSFGMTLDSLSLYGSYAFIADYFPGSGFYTVNIDESDGDYLTSYGPFTPDSWSGIMRDGVAFGDYFYLISEEDGLMIVDISDPSSIGSGDFLRSLDWTGSMPIRLMINGRYAYVADSSEGLVIVQLF